MKVILISGKACHGKDTVANIMRGELVAGGKHVLVVHFADMLKFVCKAYFDWDGVKDEKGRHILQYVGTDVIREQQPNFLVNFVASMLKLFKDEWDYVLIPDTRFPNEVDVMKSEFGALHLRVVRPDFVSPLTKEQQNHKSEVALDGYIPDAYIINNDTSPDLSGIKRVVGEWLESLQQPMRDIDQEQENEEQMIIEGFDVAK